MPIVEINNIKFKYTDNNLYNNISFTMEKGEHIVLVGPNGSGKSTLMKIIAGKISPDDGTVKWTNNIKYSYLDQYLEVNKNITISEYLYGTYSKLFNEEERMNKIYETLGDLNPNEMEKQLNIAESIREYLEQNDFYNIETEINHCIVGLGLKNVDKERIVANLSGGEKMKVFLCKMLLEKPDCILMDEPTNFLDKEHVEWLIDYLKGYKNSFLVISHDKEFLRGIANIVYAIESKNLSKYKGNYDYYLKERDLRVKQHEDAYERQQDLIKRTNIFIEKNITRASTTKMAQSRRKMLEKLDIIERPDHEYQPFIKFPYQKNPSDNVLFIENLLIGYDKPLLPELTYKIKSNERVEILGKNGIGKSTLIKTLMGKLKAISGNFKYNPSVVINYFSQEEELDMTINAIDYIRILYPMFTLEECLKSLAPLGIKGDLARKPLSGLSGGELCRVRLSRMTLKKSNLLVLDEPTNHLDQITKNALKDAIDDYDGAVILVSHEKGFADTIVDTVIKF